MKIQDGIVRQSICTSAWNITAREFFSRFDFLKYYTIDCEWFHKKSIAFPDA